MKFLRYIIMALAAVCISASAAAANGDKLQGKTICFLGDSYVRNHKRPFTETWHNKVADRHGMTYLNFGRNGSSIAFDRTKDGFGPAMTERYLSMPDTADIIVVIAGHNDADYLAARRGTWEAFSNGLDALCAGLRAKYPGKPIGFVTPWAVERPYFKEVTAEIHRICARYGIPVLDASVTGGIKVDDADFRAKYFQAPKDTAHLNSDGHDLLLDWGETFILSLAK